MGERVCREEGDHIDDAFALTPAEIARFIEGDCLACDMPADGRTNDGFASCSCCGCEWQIGDGVLTFRMPYSVTEEASDAA